MSNLARSALWYARHGWRVFPCMAQSKKPAIKGWPTLATTDVGQVETWWRVRPDSNIGLACGPATGIYAIDIDQHGVDGEQALARACAQLGPLPETVEQRTGSGGRQLLFAYPSGHEMRNKAGTSHKGKSAQEFRFDPGVDTRGEGGFVVVPPSIHPCGEPYRWVSGPHEMGLAPLPAAWVKALERRRPLTISVPITPLRNVGGTQGIDGLVRFVAQQGEGNRNAGLYWAARKVESLRRLGLVAGGHDEALKSAARHAGLSGEEAARTIASAKSAEGRR